MVYGFLLGGVVGVVGYILKKTGVDGYGWLWSGGVISTIVMWVFAKYMPGRTRKGAQEQKKWEAFRNYLKDLTRFQDMEAAKRSTRPVCPMRLLWESRGNGPGASKTSPCLRLSGITHL